MYSLSSPTEPHSADEHSPATAQHRNVRVMHEIHLAALMQVLNHDTKPLKVTFARRQFFPGLEVEDEPVGMVKAYVWRTAPESLIPYCVLFTVLALSFFRRGNHLFPSKNGGGAPSGSLAYLF